VGVDLEKKRKLLLYPIEYQRGSRCEWVLGFAKTAVMRAGSNMGRGGRGPAQIWGAEVKGDAVQLKYGAD